MIDPRRGKHHEPDFCDRVQVLIDKYAEGNASQFARQTGIPRRSVQKVIERTTLNPGVEFVQAIMDRFPGEDARWIITGRFSTKDAVAKAGKEEAAGILKKMLASVSG